MDLWYEIYAKPRIRESTAVYYKMFIDTHIRPKLGDIKLNQLQTMDIQRLYNELRENGIDVKTVSSMLGHSSAGFTPATYTHATNKVQEQAAAKMGNLLKQAL